uniref:Uncharacterized protein n=1 Tax=Rhizophora mucronata TaxID=61149 RepID=A0A2P2IMZ7_RHIMU
MLQESKEGTEKELRESREEKMNCNCNEFISFIMGINASLNKESVL